MDNKNYLEKIKDIINSNKISVDDIFKNYFSEVNKIKFPKEFNNYDTRIILQVIKLQQIYNNENINLDEFILEISFDENIIGLPTKELIINYDHQKNKIMNFQELFFKENFSVNQNPRHIFFTLKKKENEENIIKIATFSYNLSYCEFMKISDIILENKENNNKYILEFILYKDITNNFEEDDQIDLYKSIFSSPKYIYSNDIEEELYSYKISGFFFNKKLRSLII